MDEEFAALGKNHTWELVDPSSSKEEVGLKWIYKTKYKLNELIQKLKARIVAKDTYNIKILILMTPIDIFDTIRTTLYSAAHNIRKVIY